MVMDCMLAGTTSCVSYGAGQPATVVTKGVLHLVSTLSLLILMGTDFNEFIE